MGMKLSADRTFDYTPRLDERNRAHRVTATADLSGASRWWTGGTVLDQGSEGACVGFGVTAEAMASPARVKIARTLADNYARSVYRRCLQIDEFDEGERDEGTSVRAGMLVGRERNFWTGFHWAFSMGELRTALEDGPIIIGVDWHERMYETSPNGDVEIGGPIVGGHCLLITGYSANYSGRGPRYRWRNSWGTGYGLAGNGYISPANLDQILFQSGGEAAVPIGRKA